MIKLTLNIAVHPTPMKQSQSKYGKNVMEGCILKS